MNENSDPKSNRPQAEQDRTAQDRPTAETVARIYKHLQLAAAPLAEPDSLTLSINIEQRKAAIYCDISTPPEKIRQLIEEKACEIAARLDAWGID